MTTLTTSGSAEGQMMTDWSISEVVVSIRWPGRPATVGLDSPLIFVRAAVSGGRR